jgi:hypothetical protein
MQTKIHAFSGIRTHDPSVRAGEDGSCRRPRGLCDGHIVTDRTEKSFFVVVQLPWKHACLWSRYSVTAVVYLFISRSLSNNGSRCHNSVPLFCNHSVCRLGFSPLPLSNYLKVFETDVPYIRFEAFTANRRAKICSGYQPVLGSALTPIVAQEDCSTNPRKLSRIFLRMCMSV